LIAPLGGRSRAAFISVATLALALATAAPAMASTSGPPTPIDLFNGYQTCATDPGSPVYVDSFFSLPLQAMPDDTVDSSNVTEQFQVWPVSDPSQVDTLSDTSALPGFEASVSAFNLTDGVT